MKLAKTNVLPVLAVAASVAAGCSDTARPLPTQDATAQDAQPRSDSGAADASVLDASPPVDAMPGDTDGGVVSPDAGGADAAELLEVSRELLLRPIAFREDGNLLAYWSSYSQPPNQLNTTGTLHVYDVPAGASSRVAGNISPFGLRFGGDWAHIFYFGRLTNSVADASDFDRARGTSATIASNAFFDLLVATDGSAVVVRPSWVMAQDTSDVFYWEVGAQQGTRLAGGARLLPDHDLPRWFTYLSITGGGRGDLYLAHGTSTSSVARDVGASAVRVSRDRSAIAVVSDAGGGSGDLVVIRTSTGGRALVARDALTSPLEIAPDGGRVLFARATVGGDELWIHDPSGDVLISAGVGVELLRVAATESLETVVFATVTNELYRWSAASGAQRVVAASFEPTGPIALSSDGTAVLYFSSFSTATSSGELQRWRGGTTRSLGMNVFSSQIRGNADFGRVAFIADATLAGRGTLKLAVEDTTPATVATNIASLNGYEAKEDLGRILTLSYASPEAGDLVTSTDGTPEILGSGVPPAGWRRTPDWTGVAYVRAWDTASNTGTLEARRFADPGAPRSIASGVSLPFAVSASAVAFVARDIAATPALFLADLP